MNGTSQRPAVPEVDRQAVEALCDPERRAQARAYARVARRLSLASVIALGLYLLAWVGLGGPVWLSQWTARITPWLWARVALAFLLVGGGAWLVDTLFAALGHVWARRFGQSTQDWEHWLTDRIKAGLVLGVIGLILVEGVYALLASGTDTWWLWAALGAVGVQVLLTVVSPTLIAPLFFRFTPLDDPDLRARFLRLAQEAGVPAMDVYRFDMSRRTRAANAAIIGLGRTRRIVVADTLLEAFTPDEAEGVLAHELAHHVHRDIYWQVLINGLVMVVAFRTLAALWPLVAAFWQLAPADPGLLPVLGLFFQGYGLLVAPVVNLWWRQRESLADIFAVAITGKGRAYARALARLADQNLIDLWPPRWYVVLFGSHPPLGERIDMALALDREEEGSPQPPSDGGRP